jgi:Cu-Zn family superoxide dismutase
MKNPRPATVVLVFVIGALFSLTACASNQPRGDGRARASLESRTASRVTGVVAFRETASGTEVSYDLRGFSGAGQHGFHLHEKGDCSAPDGSSAGGHWNPGGHQHGDRHEDSHAGDLGNITADRQGRAQGSFVVSKFSITGEPSILGRSVIVHAQPDDLKSQPAGNSGPRIACGVVQAE